MNPAAKIVARLGGEKVISELLGLSLAQPYKWQATRAVGGTNGVIPQKYHLKLIEFARSRRIPLQARDFLQTEEMARGDDQAVA